MTIHALNKRICTLEHTRLSSQKEPTFYEMLSSFADDLQNEAAPDDEHYTAHTCLLAVDWSNPFDLWRVLGLAVSLREDMGLWGVHSDKPDEFRRNLSRLLQERGVSTAENTTMLSGTFPSSEHDVKLANELSRCLSYRMIYYERQADNDYKNNKL